MSFFKNMKVKGRFKKGHLADIRDMPSSRDRDIFLVEHALKNNIPIVVGTQKRFDELKFIDTSVQILRLADGFTFEVRNAEIPNGLLIDESIGEGMRKWLRDFGVTIRGGFSL